MNTLDIGAWLVMVVIVLGALSAISSVGKYRPPSTGGVVALAIIMCAVELAIIWALLGASHLPH